MAGLLSGLEQFGLTNLENVDLFEKPKKEEPEQVQQKVDPVQLEKDFLFDKIWGMDSFSENQTLTVHIKMLRDKIEEDSKHPKRIQTVWGVGYKYEEI